MITRRDVALGGSLTILWTAATCACGHAFGPTSDPSGGCTVFGEEAETLFDLASSAAAFATGTERLEPRSGNPDLDRALAQSLAMLARLFGVLPGFAYIQEPSEWGPGAWASSKPLLQRTDGTVLFGLAMLSNLLQRPFAPDAAVVCVCAHEFGHVLSYRNGMYARLNPDGHRSVRTEQYADFMAGYFAGTRRLRRKTFPAASFAVVMSEFGDRYRRSHGSSQERAEAVVEGFRAAYELGLSVGEASERAAALAMTRT